MKMHARPQRSNAPSPTPGSAGSRPRPSFRSSESGAALIIAIFILAILLSLVVSLAGVSRTDLRASQNYSEGIQSQALLDAGIAHAMAVLQNDAETGQDTLEEEWATVGEVLGSSANAAAVLPEDRRTLDDVGGTPYPLGDDGYYRFQILDAGSRLNVNTATREQLLLLPGLTEEIADAIIDWRDPDDTPGAQGAESDIYQGYPRPYNAKNGPFDTLDELLLVQAIDPALLYGDPSQLPAEMGADPEEPTALADLLTVRSYEPNRSADESQRINLNSATAEQLQQITDVTLSSEQAQAIVNRRNQNPYQSVADLLDVRVPPPGSNPDEQQQGQGEPLPRETITRLIDLTTVTDARTLEGRINLNTAPLSVLMTLPDMTEEVANQIISARPIETVGSLLEDSTVTDALFRGMANRVSVKSGVFIVRVQAAARPGGRMLAAEALVERRPNGGVRLLRRREVGRWPGWQSWGWEQ